MALIIPVRSVVLTFAAMALASCGSAPEEEAADVGEEAVAVMDAEPDDMVEPIADPVEVTAEPEPELAETASDSEAAPVAPAAMPVAAVALPEPASLAQCKSCHSFGEGESARIGPNLHGIYGNKAASVAGFNYSPALKSSGLVWDEKTLDEYLAAPTKLVPGGRMPMGQTNPDKRKDIIEYMKSQG
ncbi:cytochrome c family protein [Croceicoccus sp. Ery15]|uniref:c-type cytochrome n=1 Tax=Croceicoccus sp. Ery15 TaxID=1703338 RepID=UPI001E2A8846|nr:c-type cytochrome [Croceicoccus sp. Ery15]